MWKGGMLYRDGYVYEGFDYSDARGEIIMNYRKGQGTYVINVTTENLKPETEYELTYYDEEINRHELLGFFTTDEEGYGHINVRDWPVEYNPTIEGARINVRIPDVQGSWVLSTYHGTADELFEDFDAVGSERGE